MTNPQVVCGSGLVISSTSYTLLASFDS